MSAFYIYVVALNCIINTYDKMRENTIKSYNLQGSEAYE